MKKTFSLVLALLMVVCVTTGAFAQVWTHDDSGVTIELPAGMTGEDISEGDLIGLYIYGNTDNDPHYYIYIEYDSAFASTWMQDLTAESIQSIAEAYAIRDDSYTYDTVVNNGITFIRMTDSNQEEAIIIALLNGWFISVEVEASPGYLLADGAYEDLANILEGIKVPN